MGGLSFRVGVLIPAGKFAVRSFSRLGVAVIWESFDRNLSGEFVGNELGTNRETWGSMWMGVVSCGIIVIGLGASRHVLAERY